MREPLLQNLSARNAVEPAEAAMLGQIINRERAVLRGGDIVAGGSRPVTCTVLLDGTAARYRLLKDGRRQITALYVPGDFVDLQALVLDTLDQGVTAMSDCRVAEASHDDLVSVIERYPNFTLLLVRYMAIEGAIHREWIAAMGRRSKLAQLAHLICELFLRLRAVKLVEDSSFQWPLSQEEMADVLGISLVHFNKTLQRLRREGLVTWVNQTVTIRKWDRLADLAEFDGAYLYLEETRNTAGNGMAAQANERADRARAPLFRLLPAERGWISSGAAKIR